MTMAVQIKAHDGRSLPQGDAFGAAKPFLRAEGLSKRYGPVTVLSDVTLEIMPGEIHAVIGENGAGKSTLMKLLSGYVEPTGGGMLISGTPVTFTAPSQAEAQGIALVHQEILLADALTVAENLYLGRELVRRGIVDDREMRRRSAEKLAEIGCHVSPDALVCDIPLADKQLVQIGRALLDDHRMVIFDEPTAVLTGGEVERLLAIIFQLRARGIAVLYISHRLDEVQRLADKVSVLRDGRLVGTYPGQTLSQMDMARLMVGRELVELYPEKSTAPRSATPLMRVTNAVVPGYVRGVSFDVHKGEILGFAGMIGAGRTELFEGVLGLRPGTMRRSSSTGQPLRDPLGSARRSTPASATSPRTGRARACCCRSGSRSISPCRRWDASTPGLSRCTRSREAGRAGRGRQASTTSA
jgi:ribose transport system ATP-binding protein